MNSERCMSTRGGRFVKASHYGPILYGSIPLAGTCTNVSPRTSLKLAVTHITVPACPNGMKWSAALAPTVHIHIRGSLLILARRHWGRDSYRNGTLITMGCMDCSGKIMALLPFIVESRRWSARSSLTSIEKPTSAEGAHGAKKGAVRNKIPLDS
eukprot:361814-Chlamydomonas_euryale.AAC.7